eukprot:SAG31_NODE_12681_length_924_cov_2.071515_1_plen_124_part_10
MLSSAVIVAVMADAAALAAAHAPPPRTNRAVTENFGMLSSYVCVTFCFEAGRSFIAWRIAKLDGHLAYDATTDAALPPVDSPWNVYKKGKAPAPTVAIFESEAAARASLDYPPADAPKNVVFVL